MKRPLACAGFLYLVIQLLAAFLPPAAFGPLAAVFLAAVFPAWKLGGRFRTHAVLACTVTGAALLLRMAAFTWMMAPIQARAGTQAEIHAAVVETSPGFLEDTVRAGVLVDEVNGMAVRPFATGGERCALGSGETGAGGVEHGAAQSSGTALCGSSRGNDGRRPCAFDG